MSEFYIIPILIVLVPAIFLATWYSITPRPTQ